MTSTQHQQKLGDRVRSIADQLKHETALQIKATSRILGAAAQIAENHDQLIDEVVDMVENDIDQHQADQANIYTTDVLKQQFKTLSKAKAHFGLKASSWAQLVKKLQISTANSSINPPQPSVSERLDTIENELKIMHTEIAEILLLVQKLVIEK